jgi:hypothetical protein
MTWKELAEAIAKMTAKQQSSAVTLFNAHNDEFAELELTFATAAEAELYEANEPYLCTS